MKAIFLSCNQALYDEVHQTMKELGIRGFTGWEEVAGCGSLTGEPHLGDYAWPTMNSALLAFVDDAAKADAFMSSLRALDEANPQLGLRAFWWEVGGTF